MEFVVVEAPRIAPGRALLVGSLAERERKKQKEQQERRRKRARQQGSYSEVVFWLFFGLVLMLCLHMFLYYLIQSVESKNFIEDSDPFPSSTGLEPFRSQLTGLVDSQADLLQFDRPTKVGQSYSVVSTRALARVWRTLRAAKKKVRVLVQEALLQLVQIRAVAELAPGAELDSFLCKPDLFDEGSLDGGHVPPLPDNDMCRPTSPDTFAIYRVIGNDLPPRHSPNQTVDNMGFILAEEPDLEKCEKWWILNRLTLKTKQNDVIDILEENGQSYVEIPFDLYMYKKVDHVFNRGAVWKYYELYKKGMMRRYILQDQYHNKNLYIMNNNGARNACFHHGRSRVKWSLPLDGNIYLTTRMWRELLVAARSVRGCMVRYIMMPLARLVSNDPLLDPTFNGPTEADEEPQVAFRCDAREEFDPEMRYGRRPKVDLFFRLDYLGVWDKYRWDAYATMAGERNKTLSIDSGQWITCCYALRLSAGASSKTESTGGSKKKGSARHIARLDGITNFIDAIDEKELMKRYNNSQALMYTPQLMSAFDVRGLQGQPTTAAQWSAFRLIDKAEKYLDVVPQSVADKTGEGSPSGDKNHYYSLHPDYIPDATKETGVPFVLRQPGQEVPKWVALDRESSKYDFRRWIETVNNITTFALAWKVSGDMRFAQKGALLFRVFFANPRTRMNPSFMYARMIYTGELLPKFQGLTGGKIVTRFVQGHYSGINEALPLYYMLDAVRLLHDSGTITTDEIEEFRWEWLLPYYKELTGQPQSVEEADLDPDEDAGAPVQSRQAQDCERALDHDGALFDVQLCAISAFIGQMSTFQGVVQRTLSKLLRTLLYVPFRVVANSTKEGEPRRDYGVDHFSTLRPNDDYCKWLHAFELLTRISDVVGLKDVVWRDRRSSKCPQCPGCDDEDCRAHRGMGLRYEFRHVIGRALQSDMFQSQMSPRGEWLGPVDPEHEADLLRVGAVEIGCDVPPHWALVAGAQSSSAEGESTDSSDAVRPSGNCMETVKWMPSSGGDNSRPTVSLEEGRRLLDECLGRRPTKGFMTFAEHSGFTNQVKALLNAIKVASVINRTLVVPPIQPQMMMAFGSCKTNILPVDVLISWSDTRIRELIDAGVYQEFASVINFESVSKSVTLIDWRNYHTFYHPELADHGISLTNDCMDTKWIHGYPELHDTIMETHEAKLSKPTNDPRHRAYGILSNETWTEEIIYREVETFFEQYDNYPLVRVGSWFGEDLVIINPQAMRDKELLRKTQVLFFSEVIVEAAKRVKSLLGPSWWSWHLRIGDTFVKDAQRRAAEAGITLTMEQIIYGVSSQVEENVPEGSVLYIATDLPEVERRLYIPHILQKYQVYTLDAFDDILKSMSQKVFKGAAGHLDMMISVCAPRGFFPTPGSSFSAYIRNLRRNHACEY